MATVDRERLRTLLQETGRSARSVSLAAKLGATAVKDILSGKSRDPGTATISAIAEQLGVPLGELIADMGEAAPTKRRRQREMVLPIRYEVAAGGFHPRDDYRHEPFGHARIPAVAPYEDFEQWLERVVSDSMDRVIPVNSLLHVVDAIQIAYEPRHGDVVIVERSRAQGSLVERTVKQIEMTPKGPVYWPRSHNPRFQTPFTPDDFGGGDEDAEVRIAGLVIRAIQMFVPELGAPNAA